MVRIVARQAKKPNRFCLFCVTGQQMFWRNPGTAPVLRGIELGSSPDRSISRCVRWRFTIDLSNWQNPKKRSIRSLKNVSDTYIQSIKNPHGLVRICTGFFFLNVCFISDQDFDVIVCSASGQLRDTLTDLLRKRLTTVRQRVCRTCLIAVNCERIEILVQDEWSARISFCDLTINNPNNGFGHIQKKQNRSMQGNRHRPFCF